MKPKIIWSYSILASAALLLCLILYFSCIQTGENAKSRVLHPLGNAGITLDQQADVTAQFFNRPLPEGLTFRDLVKESLTTELAESEPHPAGLGVMVTGNFIGNSDQEILLVQPISTWVISVDGQTQKFPTPPPFRSLNTHMVSTWDYDHDGIDELVPDYLGWLCYVEGVSLEKVGVGWDELDKGLEQINEVQARYEGRLLELPVFNVRGQVMAEISVVPDAATACIADMDGDGFDELVARTNCDRGEYTVFGRYCKEVWSMKLKWLSGVGRAGNLIPGDFDDDGREELFIQDHVVTKTSFTTLSWLFDMTEQPVTIDDPGIGIMPGMFMCVADVNNDGADEMIGFDGIADIHNGQLIMFRYPRRDMPQIGKFVAGDCNRDGKMDLFQYGIYGGKEGSCIYWFDRHGKTVTYKEMGGPGGNLFTAKAGGHDYLIVQTPDRILIYP